jgi:hypothetical protein
MALRPSVMATSGRALAARAAGQRCPKAAQDAVRYGAHEIGAGLLCVAVPEDDFAFALRVNCWSGEHGGCCRASLEHRPS